jgi:fumarate hydratase class II
MSIAAARSFQDVLLPGLETLLQTLEAKATEFHPILKVGRTHAQDATPMRLGHEFSGYATQVKSLESYPFSCPMDNFGLCGRTPFNYNDN